MSELQQLEPAFDAIEQHPEVPTIDQAIASVDDVMLALVNGDTHNRDYAHPRRVSTLLEQYGPSIFPKESILAAILHDIPDRDGKSDAFYNSLYTFFESVDPSTQEYVSALVNDMDDIEHQAEGYRRSASSTISAGSSFEGNKELEAKFINAIQNGEKDALPEEFWLVPSGICNPKEMLTLLKNVNLESVVIKALEILDNLRNPPKRDAALLQDVFEAEYFYAPLCEILGYDGIAMSLTDQAWTTRLEKSGNGDKLVAADVILRGIDDEAIYGIYEKLHLKDGFELEHVVTDPDRKIGDALLALDLGNQSLDHLVTVWRLKSKASIARKLLTDTYKSANIADIFATTIITDTLEQTGQVFKRMKSLTQIDGVDATIAASKNSSRYVKGSQKFIRQATALSGYSENIETETGLFDFEVAKQTIVVQTTNAIGERIAVPVEIQVLTKDARNDSRLGLSAHILYKLRKAGLDFDLKDTITSLASIHDRKTRLKSTTVEINGQSRNRLKVKAENIGNIAVFGQPVVA